MDVSLAVYTAISLCLHPMMNLYSMFTVLASTSMINLYNMFLYKFHQIIPILNSRKSTCVHLSSFDEQFELFITHRPTVRTWAPNNSTLWPSGLAALTLVALPAAAISKQAAAGSQVRNSRSERGERSARCIRF